MAKVTRESLAREYVENRDTYCPWVFAQTHSGGRWKPYRHLVYVLKVIRKAILEGNGRVIVSMPPRYGKTLSVCNWLPAWYLNNWPNKHIMMVSYADTFAQKASRRVRGIIGNLPNANATISQERAAVSEWELTQGGGFVAVGLGGAATGQPADLLLMDDLVKSRREAESPTYRQHVIDEFDATFYTRLEPGATAVIVMTRWHERDICGYLEHEHADDWNVVRLSAIAEEEDQLGRQPGEPLCPDRYTLEQVLKRKLGTSPATWAGLYQQRPAPPEGRIVNPAWLKFYDDMPSEFERVWQSWDLTFEGDEDGSHVVGQTWGRVGGNFFLLDQYRDQVEFPDQLEAIRAARQQWSQATEIRIEKKANGAAAIAMLRDSIPGITPVSPMGSKVIRFEAVSPYFKSGNVYLPSRRRYSWVGDYVHEITTFPGSKSDDQVDATSQALTSYDGEVDLVFGIA